MIEVENNIERLVLEGRKTIEIENKKDPHIPDDVNQKKERFADLNGSQVMMKMAVSFNDHKLIIGRGGKYIKRIIKDTNALIHFPDFNRINSEEKSNQVSLCGSLDAVERARALLRLSTPLTMSFYRPARIGEPKLNKTPFVKELANKFHVIIVCSRKSERNLSLVTVKGFEEEADKVKEATQLLINFTCVECADKVLVKMQLEIYSQHHEIIKGNNNENLVNIMKNTKTRITFPNLCNAKLKPKNRSHVFITGKICGVYKAKQQLLGNLPVTLMFNFPEHNIEIEELMDISNKYGVIIYFKHRMRQNKMAIIVKSVEKFVGKIYEARHEILRLKTMLVKPEIPRFYFSRKNKELETAAYNRSLMALASYQDSTLMPHDSEQQGSQNHDGLFSPTYRNEDGFGGQQPWSEGELLEHEGTAAGCEAEGETYHNQNFNLWQQGFDFDMMKSCMILKAPISNELSTPSGNWINLELNSPSPTPLETCEDNVWNIVSEYADSGLSSERIPIYPYYLVETTELIDSTPYDLIQTGIKAFDACKELKKSKDTLQANDDEDPCMPSSSNSALTFSGSVAPGAERRRTSNDF